MFSLGELEDGAGKGTGFFWGGFLGGIVRGVGREGCGKGRELLIGVGVRCWKGREVLGIV